MRQSANLHLTNKCGASKQSNCISRTKWTHLRLDRMRRTRMQTCTWSRSAALASKKQLRILSKAIRRMYIWLPRTKWTHLRLDRALLKDANLHLTKKFGAGCHGVCSADAPQSQGCKPALGQAFKARQTSADAPQGCKLALDQEVALASKKQLSISRICLLKPVYLRLDRALLMRHKDAHLTKKCGTGFQKAISRMSLYICFCIERNIDIFKAQQGPVGAAQGCKPALGQEVRHWLLKSS